MAAVAMECTADGDADPSSSYTAPASLRDRLEARHKKSLEEFQHHIQEWNGMVDQRQRERVFDLKTLLRAHHAEAQATLEAEATRVATHHNFLAQFREERQSASGGEVRPALVDLYHTASDRDFQAPRERMQAERERLLQLTVWCRQRYQERQEAITQCVEGLEAEEAQRRNTIQDALQALMVQLSKTSFCSITAAHVIAQRVIHHVNEHIASNYLASRTLLSQLRRREVLKLAAYHQQFANLYTSLREGMATSSLWWLRSLLQSPVFRRPQSRMDAVERIARVSCDAQREAKQFLSSLAVTLQSLHERRDLRGREDRIVQPLGGTHPSGWLRHFDETLQADPFPTDPSEVVDEWRMKAIVVVRNSLASIVALSDTVQLEERVRVGDATALLDAFRHEIEWLFAPISGSAGELDMLTRASLSCYELDQCFLPLVEADERRSAQYHDAGIEIARPALAALESECQWFHTTVENGLQESHRVFEESILLAYKSVLRQFEKATEALVAAVRGTYGFVRHLFHNQEAARQDYEDRLALLEEDFEIVTHKLTHAASMNTAHGLFAEGIGILDHIATSYTSYNRQFLADLEHFTQEAAVKTAEVYRHLAGKLGVESLEDTRERQYRERRRRVEEHLSKLMLEQSHGKKGGRGKKKNTDSTPTPVPSDGTPDGHSSSLTNTQQLATIEAELDREPLATYPQLKLSPAAAEGVSSSGKGPPAKHEVVVFNVVHPVAFIEDVAVPSSAMKEDLEASISSRGSRRGNSSRRKGGTSSPSRRKDAAKTTKTKASGGGGKRSGSGAAEDRDASLMADGLEDGTAVATVEKAFVASYLPLFQSNIAHPECFIEQSYITDWTETMRLEILQWLLALRADCAKGIQDYVQRSTSEAEVQINSLLRNHRRRPATFQADVYEARVRELENKSTQSEKYCARLLERVAKLETTVLLLRHDPAQATADERTLHDLQEISKKVEEASSKHVLQVLERRHASRRAHYTDSYGSQKQRVLEAAGKQKEVIEADAAHYLAERTKQLSTEEYGDGTLEEAVERDTLCIRVRNILERLQLTMESVQAYAAEEASSRHERMAEAKRRYDELHQRSVEELELLAFVQETFSRVKLQTQTLIQRSKAEEDRIGVAIRTVEDTVQHPHPRLRTEAVLRELFTKDYGLAEGGSSSGGGGGESGGTARRRTQLGSGTHHHPPPAAHASVSGAKPQRHSAGDTTSTTTTVPPELAEDIAARIREEMEAKLCLAKVQYQRLLQTCPAATLLGVLDELREMLYLRGVSLNALSWAVELVRVQPEHYIEPKIPPKETEGGSSGGSSGSSGSGKRRPARNVKGVPSVTLPLDPLPPATVMESHVLQTIQTAEKEVRTAVQRHFVKYPTPLLRASPLLLKASTEEEALAAVQTLSDGPLQRFKEYRRTATVTYHEHVQRLFVALQLVPQFLTSSLLHLASTSLVNRIQNVMDTCGHFYAHSSALKVHHQGLIKVALASQCNRDKLEQLNTLESVRQTRTKAITTWLWGCAIKELQEEVGLHAARCVHTTSTFFQLLKGLTSPEHLTPCEVELTVGYHRGLKHLLRLREKDGRLRDMTDVESGATDGGATTSAAKGGRTANASAAHGKNNATGVPDAVPAFRSEGSKDGRGRGAERALVPDSSGHLTVPVPQYSEVEYPGLPISRFKPVEQFNSQHPQFAVTAPLGARLYYPPSAAAEGGGGAGATSSNAPGGASGRKGKRGVVKPELPEESELLSPSIVAPATRLHQQSVLFAVEALEELTRTSTVVVNDANSAFQAMEDREGRWVERWQLTLQRLQRSGGPLVSMGIVNPNGNATGGGAGNTAAANGSSGSGNASNNA